MISIVALFWILVVLFAIIGATRGRTKEFLVSLSAFVALFFNIILEQYVPFYEDLLNSFPGGLFIVRGALLVIVVILGYVTPNMPIFRGREPVITKIKDAIWGLAFGALNGYLIVGSLWWYLNDANYPFSVVTAPDASTAMGKAALDLIPRLPPALLTPPGIYFAIAIAFVIVLAAFV